MSEFIRRITVDFVSRGYFFYVKGEIPEGKNPAKTDDKIIRQYGIAVSKWTRARQKRKGQARVQYLRHGREFVILATHGKHPFFHEESQAVRDVRRVPLKLFEHTIGNRTTSRRAGATGSRAQSRLHRS